MVDYGRHSETERVLVSDEGLTIRSLLKIQSDPLGNMGEFVGRRNEFTYAAGPGVRSGIKEFGRSAIPDNQSRQQLVNHRHLSGFHAWLLQVYKRKDRLHTERRNEFTNDVQTRQSIFE